MNHRFLTRFWFGGSQSPKKNKKYNQNYQNDENGQMILNPNQKGAESGTGLSYCIIHEIHIISGYRSPTYNGDLRRGGHGVARHSLHMKGKAIDISVPGVGLDKLRRVALNLRYGGVGYYPGPGFVHIDSGNFRIW